MDRVFGILLGLMVMWIVFDLLGGVPAVDRMVAGFRVAVLRLADLQELSFTAEAPAIAHRVQEIRENLVGIFASINTEADAVWLETGPRRSRDLLVRKSILAVLPPLRSLLLLQVTVLQYRRQRPLHELPPAIAAAQQNFDRSIAGFLRTLAVSYPGHPSAPETHPLEKLRSAVTTYYSQTSGGQLSATAVAVLSLSQSINATLQSIFDAENLSAGA